MAAAAPSPLASSVEKTNGAKLSRLLIDGGTTILRNVFDSYHPPANLAADLTASYVTLYNLKRRKVLYQSQWDKLFPPGGATPDSKTFDITLLFLLLTNICGLSPPPSGWHKPPPSSDTSFEANLARVKLYRNELYGHVTSTGVVTALFNVKWQEISAVLVALGLNPAEVVRLKAAPCGEDYINAVIEWVKSDGEIKAQLREVLEIQQEARQMQEDDHRTLQDTHKAVEFVLRAQQEEHHKQQKARQVQEDDHKILQHTNRAVEDVRQIHQDTHKVVKEILKTQQEEHQKQQKARQIQEEDRRTLQDAHKVVEGVMQDTHKIVEEVLKTQQEEHQKQQEACEEDHRTLLDTHKAVEGVMQIHQDTNQQVKTILKTQQEVRHTQLEDHESLQINKSTLEDVRQKSTRTQEMLSEVHLTQTKTKETVEGVAKTQEERFKAVEADLQEIKKSFGSLKEERNRERQKVEVLCSLAKSEFNGDVEYHLGRFQEGTREWVFNKVQNWLDDRNSSNRVMVISANAGMGKSVIAAAICKRMQENGKLSGSHFCQHNNARYRNPQLMLQSLASHLCHALSKYKRALVKQLSRNLGKDLNNMGVEELFALLFKEPLSSVTDPGRNMLMVIDGLDESEYQDRNELLDVIANQFCKLPCWIRLLCTTRPEKNISEALKHLKPFQLEPNEEENVKDIKLFLEKKTQYLMRPENKGAIVDKLVEKSEGLMLYAHFVVSFIEENVSVLDQRDLDGSLPLAISSVYHSYFKRLENELMKELGVKEENFLNLLYAVTAAREPLPIGFVYKVLVPNTNPLLARRKVVKVIGSVSSLLPMRDGCVHVFHKSVQDWLTDTSCYGEHDFTVDEKQGHRILASLCSDELDNLKQKGVHETQFSRTEKYALQHGVRHMLHLSDDMATGECNLEQCVQTYVIDLELVYAKLYVSTSVAEDILWLQRQEIFQLLPDESKSYLDTLLSLFRKYQYTLTSRLKVFFQTVLAEGGTVLSSQASNILKTKYPEIPYMEYVHKAVQQGTVLVRFQCSSQVACFDVSPELDYMVCECKDGTIHLWSLSTGKLLWSRPVKIIKRFQLAHGAYRKLPSSPVFSFYRSVVFHPSKDVVLPGVLSHAYTLDGDLRPLFPESKCSFTVCSISGDKTKMLTDCPDDAKCIIMWSLKNGSEVTRITRNEDVLSFAWSRDGKLLAISHSTGSVCFVDVMDSCRLLAQTATPNVCGIIKLSPDSRFLFCWYKTLSELNQRLYRLNIDLAEDPSVCLDVSDDVSYVPWKFESRSVGGFLLGDPLSSLYETSSPGFFDWAFDFVLNEGAVLRGYPHDIFVDMLNINEVIKADREATYSSIENVVFSWTGEMIYTFSGEDASAVRAWDLLSGELIVEKSIGVSEIRRRRYRQCNHLLAVKEGVLFATGGTLQLWNFELSKCVRSWTSLEGITQMVPVSGDLERVACEAGNKVIILDTTSGKIVSTVSPRKKHLIACNSKCQLLSSFRRRHLCLSDGKTILWEKVLDLGLASLDIPIGMFSRSERFALVGASHGGMYVLDAVSGETLYTLCKVGQSIYFKFISDEECVISSNELSEGYCLQLFNVKSGDVLSEIKLEREVHCLAACPRKRLLAIAQSDSQQGFKLIQVHLPQDKDSRKIKRSVDNQGSTESKQATGSSQKRGGDSPSCSDSKPSKLTPDHRIDLIIKEGTPENVDLERLAQKIPDHWKKLGRRLLEDDEEALSAIHKENEECCEKAYKMLLKWKRAKGAGATYRVLHDALCHDLVNRQDLAEKFCL